MTKYEQAILFGLNVYGLCLLVEMDRIIHKDKEDDQSSQFKSILLLSSGLMCFVTSIVIASKL